MDLTMKDLRSSFDAGISRDLGWRLTQLQALHTLLVQEEERLCEAVARDLRKGRMEAMMTEVNLCKLDAAAAIRHLRTWTADAKVAKALHTITDATWIQPQPLGVVLVMGAWNYPIQLVVLPLIGALAAGNCVLVKPSEVSHHTASLLAELIPKYLDRRCCRVEVLDGPGTQQMLDEHRFDKIFYTGSTTIGRSVMQQAAKYLTPVVLELGGKCPVYVAEDSDLHMAATRVMWGKLMNCGQTCIAPDYALVAGRERTEAFLRECVAVVERFYGANPKESADLGRIVNKRHFERLSEVLRSSEGRVVCGGLLGADADDLYLPPTIVADAPLSDATMREELFGPILPVYSLDAVSSASAGAASEAAHDQAITFINEREKPLSIYLFTKNKTVIDRFKATTSSGCLLINDTMVQGGVDGLPFGGVGYSGTGCYHGKFTFEAFSHYRSCINKDTMEALNDRLRYPPYDASKLSWINWFFRSNPSTRRFCNIM